MREPTQPVTYDQVSAIRVAFAASQWESSGLLGRDAGVSRSTAWRLLDKAMEPGDTASFSVRALESILPKLGLNPVDFIAQFRLPLELDERFIKQAEKAVSQGIRDIAQALGSVHAIKLNAIVALEIHGATAEQQSYARKLSLPVPQAKRRAG